MNPAGKTLKQLADALEGGAVSSRTLVESALEALESDSRAFTRVDHAGAMAAADRVDRLRAVGSRVPPFAGVPISVRDLLDVAGEVTTAGSVILRDHPLATADAPSIARLRAAGFVLIGRTHMSEFAFTGLGLNPHGPQPPNPRDPTRVPGGSSSGAAVSVALGQAAMGLGTDTGGSVRIPAAFCGLVGFKPTQRRITRDGVLPLSTTLDSIGPIANSVACVRAVDRIIADGPEPAHSPVALSGLRLGVPDGYLLSDMSLDVAAAFEKALAALSRAGAVIAHFDFPELDQIPAINGRGTISSAEVYGLHRRLGLLAERRLYDPNVLARIEIGAAMSAADYLDLLTARAALIADADRRTAGFDALIAPTTPILAPRIAEVEEPADFSRLNALALRNPSVVNLLDRCAIGLPVGRGKGPSCGLMLIGQTLGDARLLAIAEAVEAVRL